MVAFSVLLGVDTARIALRAVAEAARPRATARWEHELVRWLDAQAAHATADATLEVGDLAWSPDRFQSQRRFVLAAVAEADIAPALAARWTSAFATYPRASVKLGRLWQFDATL